MSSGEENSKAYILTFDRRMLIRNMVQWGAIGYVDGSDCSVSYFDVGLPPISISTFVVK